MAYACGDCYTQYKIDSIYLDSGNRLIKGEDVNLEYIKNGKEVEINEEIDSCWICYDYYIEGKMQNNLFRSKIIEIEKFNFKLRKNCCE